MAFKTEGIEGTYGEYCGKPLVRNNNVIVWGSMEEPYILYMTVLSEKEVTFGSVTDKAPDKVLVQVMSTDTSRSMTERMVKQGVKNGLYEAIDIGVVWMEQLTKKK